MIFLSRTRVKVYLTVTWFNSIAWSYFILSFFSKFQNLFHKRLARIACGPHIVTHARLDELTMSAEPLDSFLQTNNCRTQPYQITKSPSSFALITQLTLNLVAEFHTSYLLVTVDKYMFIDYYTQWQTSHRYFPSSCFYVIFLISLFSWQWILIQIYAFVSDTVFLKIWCNRTGILIQQVKLAKKRRLLSLKYIWELIEDHCTEVYSTKKTCSLFKHRKVSFSWLVVKRGQHLYTDWSTIL